MLTPVVRLFLSVVVGGGDELLSPTITEPPQQVISPSPEAEHWINLEADPSAENECKLGSYSCRLACLNGGVCFKNSANLRFFLLGDTGGLPIYPYSTYAQNVVAKQLAKIGDENNIEFTVSAGDNVYFTGVKDEFDPRFQSSFEKVYDGKALQKPWYLIAGNHDHFGNISGQIAYTNRSKRWTYPASYYKASYAFGKNSTLVEFLMIDTIVLCGNTRDIVEAGFFEMLFATVDKNPNTPKDPVAAQQELDWIEQELSSSRADYLFVVGHYPLYSVSEHGSMDCLIEKLKPLLERYHVSAYVAGHDHTLQHIVTEHPFSSGSSKMVPLHYIISGAASRTDRSTKHIDTVPEGSLRFNYPTGINPFSQIGLSNGGFIYVEMNEDRAELKFYNGKASEKYKCTIEPRFRSREETATKR